MPVSSRLASCRLCLLSSRLLRSRLASHVPRLGVSNLNRNDASCSDRKAYSTRVDEGGLGLVSNRACTVHGLAATFPFFARPALPVSTLVPLRACCERTNARGVCVCETIIMLLRGCSLEIDDTTRHDTMRSAFVRRSAAPTPACVSLEGRVVPY
ncbi:hypothetical protein BDZ90DRAFT_234122 [Jaminaea rosea]|uniref:Uncharacterized protein n=1 Tax=Jaminaea rosea TaxID=1569628 RepID=A0A316UK13_9BASI|nr:hypothetical protein BDZ90DRAFT_234122 [Jaminaea rosea]PWN25274.1 hypothetical protein BDZ90DRAFT_234122 [Jaminaea rosea]